MAVQHVAHIATGTIFNSIHFTAAIRSNSWSAPSAGADVSYDQTETASDITGRLKHMATHSEILYGCKNRLATECQHNKKQMMSLLKYITRRKKRDRKTKRK